MLSNRIPNMKLPSLLATLLLATSCAGGTTYAPPPTSTDAGQPTQTTRRPPPSTRTPLAGGEFNKFFPSSAGGFERVYTQEKTGSAIANLKKDGKVVAVLSIADTANNAAATRKFDSSNRTIAGYPAATQGTTVTSILVGDRFQVKVQSRDASFTERDREDWLQKFNLRGLKQLSNA